MNTYTKLDQPEVLSHIFAPTKEARSPLPENATDLDVELGDNTLLGCRFYKADKDDPTILFFHGNGETVSDYDLVAQKYAEFGMNLFLTTYRGYGWSTGSPSVAKMFEDAEAVFGRITSWLADNGYSDRVFVMGRSLGSAGAIDLVETHQESLKGLIVESGFADTIPLAANLGIDVEGSDITEDDCFNNTKKISNIKIPTYILHGSRDTLIPVPLAEKLQASSGARNKQFTVIPGADHNTMIETGGDLYFQAIKKFIDTVCGQHEWRYRRKQFRQYKDNKK